MPAKVKVNGVWKDVAGSKVKVNGTWRDVGKSFTKVDGEWKIWYSPSNPFFRTTLTYNQTGPVDPSDLEISQFMNLSSSRNAIHGIINDNEVSFDTKTGIFSANYSIAAQNDWDTSRISRFGENTDADSADPWYPVATASFLDPVSKEHMSWVLHPGGVLSLYNSSGITTKNFKLTPDNNSSPGAGTVLRYDDGTLMVVLVSNNDNTFFYHVDPSSGNILSAYEKYLEYGFIIPAATIVGQTAFIFTAIPRNSYGYMIEINPYTGVSEYVYCGRTIMDLAADPISGQLLVLYSDDSSLTCAIPTIGKTTSMTDNFSITRRINVQSCARTTQRMTVDSNGNVYVIDPLKIGKGGAIDYLHKLDGSTLELIWSRRFEWQDDSTFFRDDEIGSTLSLDIDENPIYAANTRNDTSVGLDIVVYPADGSLITSNNYWSVTDDTTASNGITSQMSTNPSGSLTSSSPQGIITSLAQVTTPSLPNVLNLTQGPVDLY